MEKLMKPYGKLKIVIVKVEDTIRTSQTRGDIFKKKGDIWSDGTDEPLLKI